jgi:predicted aspartyl protease
MKTKIALGALLAVLSPVKPMIYIALLSIFIDTGFGVWRSVKKGGWKAIRSRRLSHTISKSLLYSVAITFVYLIEKFIAADLIAHFIAIELIMTKVVALGCVFVEILSINESYKDVTGVNILKSLRSFVTRAKEEASNITK